MSQSNIRLISASAGSGKTYRLTVELSALLDPSGKHAYQPSQIIATTFTRAAAGELRSRVREKILEKGGYSIASMLDQSLIGTVNSISEQLLALYAFELGLSPVLRVVEEDEAEVLFQSALSLALNEKVMTELEELNARFSLTQRDTRHAIHEITNYARANSMDEAALQHSMQDSIDSLKCGLPTPDKNLDTLMAVLKKELPTIKKRVEKLEDETEKTNKCVDTCAAAEYLVRNDLVFPWYNWGTLAKMDAAKKSKAVFEEVIRAAKDHMQTDAFHNDLYDYIKLCFQAAIDSLQFYKQLKNARGLVDFIDQEAFLIDALDHTEVQARFRQQFKVLMVDEFQDTSPMQLSLFLKMAALVEKVIWVGDPKQAIYGFRGSDAELIGTVTEALGKLEKQDILQNSYRSRPELVEIVNTLFVPAFQKNKADLPEDQIALKPTRNTEAKLKKPFQLWAFKWEGEKRHNAEKFNSHLAERIATFLSEKAPVQDPDTKEIREIKAGDITILCRSNKDCRDVANQLRRQGLQAVVAANGMNVTAEFRFVRACLHLLVDETDSLSKAELAFLDDANHDVETMLEERLEYLEEVGEDYTKRNQWLADNSVIQWIGENRSELLAQPVSGMLHLLYAGLNLYKKVMQWGNGGQRQANLQQLLFYSGEFEDYCSKLGLLPNVHGFLGWFDTLADTDQDARGLVANELSVNVMTYHRAKGLEWPVVMLYGLDKNHDPDIFRLRVHSKDKIDFAYPLQGRTLRLWPWPYKATYYGKLPYKPFSDCCEASQDFAIIENKQSLEALRLLYVGFTRARDYLVLTYAEGPYGATLSWLQKLVDEGQKAFTGDQKEPGDYQVPNKYFSSAVRVWRTAFADVAEEAKAKGKTVLVYEDGSVKDYAPFIINPSKAESLSEVSFHEGSVIGEAIQIQGLIMDEKSAFGTFVHQVMCAWRQEMSEAETHALIKKFAVAAGVDDPMLEKELGVRVKGFYDWLGNTLKPVRIYKELPLMQEKDWQVIVGVADMVLETEEEMILIDYKTFRGDEKALEWKAKSFSGQLAMYERVLRKEFGKKRVKSGVYFLMEGRVMWMEEMHSIIDQL